jgi:hypothetical protein
MRKCLQYLLKLFFQHLPGTIKGEKTGWAVPILPQEKQYVFVEVTERTESVRHDILKQR